MTSLSTSQQFFSSDSDWPLSTSLQAVYSLFFTMFLNVFFGQTMPMKWLKTLMSNWIMLRVEDDIDHEEDNDEAQDDPDDGDIDTMTRGDILWLWRWSLVTVMMGTAGVWQCSVGNYPLIWHSSLGTSLSPSHIIPGYKTVQCSHVKCWLGKNLRIFVIIFYLNSIPELYRLILTHDKGQRKKDD